MSALDTAPYVADALQDLALLDDDRHHARCPLCQPTDNFEPFTALCGRRAMHTHVKPAVRLEAPPNACPDCYPIAEAMIELDAPCPQCGGYPFGAPS